MMETDCRSTLTHLPRSAAIACFILIAVVAAPVRAFTVTIDYSYDSTGFFGSGNPQGSAAGAQARASLEAAAAFFSDLLTDTFSEISTPPAFSSASFDGVVNWEWTMVFGNPATGGVITPQGPSIAADQYLIFAGARNLSSESDGGPGGYGWNVGNNGGAFTSAEITQINAITTAFENQVTRRGEPSGFARWGGAVAFDSAPVVPWHFNHTTPPVGNVLDFYSTSLHQLAHALGFGASAEWDAFVTGLGFNGPHAVAAHGGTAPLADPHHWAANVMSPILGTEVLQQAAMVWPAANGRRRQFTRLDAAALADIGWSIAEVPEPGSGALFLIGLLAVAGSTGRVACPRPCGHA